MIRNNTDLYAVARALIADLHRADDAGVPPISTMHASTGQPQAKSSGRFACDYARCATLTTHALCPCARLSMRRSITWT